MLAPPASGRRSLSRAMSILPALRSSCSLSRWWAPVSMEFRRSSIFRRSAFLACSSRDGVLFSLSTPRSPLLCGHLTHCSWDDNTANHDYIAFEELPRKRLFTQVRGRGVLGTSPEQGSRKFGCSIRHSPAHMLNTPASPDLPGGPGPFGPTPPTPPRRRRPRPPGPPGGSGPVRPEAPPARGLRLSTTPHYAE